MSHPENLAPSILVTVLFFLWGVPDNLNDVLIRQFMKSIVLNRFQAGLVQSAFYLGYFLFALPAALFMSRRGYKAGILRGWCCSVSARFCSGLQPLLLNTLVSCSRSS